MLAVTILGSGSAGNCALVETPGCRLLVDGGLSALQIRKRLKSVGVEPETIDAILITHEHSDHIAGLDTFCKGHDVPVYCNMLTMEAIQRASRTDCPKNFQKFLSGSEFMVKDIGVQTFKIQHDADDPVGFVLQHGPARLGVCTDLGFVTKLVRERLRGADTVLIEANHDRKMLQECPNRPWSLKQRIMSNIGHLSNEASAELVAELAQSGLRRAILGHLSRDCNLPELALGTVRQRLAADGAPVDVFCASQGAVTGRFEVLAAQMLS